jgi:hypothetical protein
MDKPVRKVRSNGRTIVGLVSSNKNTSVQFESSLEENFLYLLSFDKEVKKCDSQPTRISYIDSNGKDRTYVPDYLVEYLGRPSILFEVKTREWIKHNLSVHKMNNEAAKQFAAEKNWEFRVITDKQLRTEFVNNVRRLFRYQDYPIDREREDFIRASLRNKGMPIEELVRKAKDKELLTLATVWAMLFDKKLSANLLKPLTMKTRVTLCNDPRKIKCPYL